MNPTQLGQLGQAVLQNSAAIGQRLDQLNAHLREAGDVALSSINGFYREAKRFMRAFDEQRGLRYRPSNIVLSASISGAGTASSGSDDFRVAQNEDFIVHEVRGFIMVPDLPAQAAIAAIGGSLGGLTTVHDMLLAKAQNTRFTLLNKDTKVPITENEGMGFASIIPELGGVPLKYQPDNVPGFIIPHNMTLQVQFALQDTDAFYNTVATTYGLVLSGVYMSREVR